MPALFHLAFPVHDLAAAKQFYVEGLGCVLGRESDRAKAKGLTFYQQPRRRFAGTRIEHLTFFLQDPSRNLLEFKYYRHESAIFGERDVAAVGDAE
mgnify:CR=1 FL=1